jgi:very-short-patch-repair endonuclease
LIIEADGGVHALRTFDDAKRDAWLTSQGFRVLRFSNSDILARPNHVLAAIRDVVAKRPFVRLRLPPSPEMGEGSWY